MKKTRAYYEDKFAAYDDVVTLPQLREMLGGVCDKTVRKLVRSNRIRHYFVNKTYYIPKQWVIDFVLSDYYYEYRDKLSVVV